jgi:hypothetical protein
MLIAGLPLPVQAYISYGSFEGDTVYFNDVGESTSSTGDPDGLFGGELGPQVVGNQLLFFPTDFFSESNGVFSDTTSATLQFELQAKDDHLIERIRIQEIGDYTLNGSGTSAKVNGMMTATDMAGPNGILYDSFNVEYAYPDSFGVFDEYWEIEFSNPTTRVQISLNNNLQTASDTASSSSFIQKKVGDAAVTLTVNPDPVPIPGALYLFTSGVGFGVWCLRKKNKKQLVAEITAGRQVDRE